MPISNINKSTTDSNNLRGYSIPGDLYDVVKGWFQGKNFTISAADLMAKALISAVIDNNGSRIDVLDTLKAYNSSTAAEMQELTAYLLNSNRLRTSFTGYETAVATNKVYARLVV